MIEHDFKTLRRSSRGYLVRHLQNLLNIHMSNKIDVDGAFGPATETKVMTFQRMKALELDGIVGPNTWQELLRIPKEGGNSYANYELMYIEDHIPKSAPYSRRPGKRFTMGGLDYNFNQEWVTIHNTGNSRSTAKNERAWLLNPSNDRVACWHRVVDQHYCIDAVPHTGVLGEVAFHAGSFVGNNKSIGIESVESGDLGKVYQATVKVAAITLLANNLPIWKLTTHNMWSGKNCPRILKLKWSQFVLDVYATLRELKSSDQDTPINEPIQEPKEPIKEPIDQPDEVIKDPEEKIEDPIEKPDETNKEEETPSNEKQIETNKDIFKKITEMVFNLIENILK